MAVEVNTTRKAVEIAWETGGGETEPTPPDAFPSHPIVLPPEGEEGAHPEHPIYLPPYIDNSLPETPEGETPPEGAFPGDPGYNPPSGAAVPTPQTLGEVLAVQVFAQGQEGDWSNSPVMPNDGDMQSAPPKTSSGSPATSRPADRSWRAASPTPRTDRMAWSRKAPMSSAGVSARACSAVGGSSSEGIAPSGGLESRSTARPWRRCRRRPRSTWWAIPGIPTSLATAQRSLPLRLAQ